MKKRVLGLTFSLLVLGVFVLPLVSAQQGPIELIANAINQIVDAFEPLFNTLLGGTPNGEFLFAKVLFLVIVFSIIWVALSRVDFFSETIWVLWLVSGAASILATRWIASEELVQSILLPYTAVGIAFSAGLPFILYFLVVNVGFSGAGHRLTRKVSWIFFAVVFIGLWFARYDTITSVEDAQLFGLYIYPTTAILAFLMFWFDGTINRYMVNLMIEKHGVANKQDLITELQRKVNQADDDFTNGIITASERDKRQKSYKKKIAHLHK